MNGSSDQTAMYQNKVKNSQSIENKTDNNYSKELTVSTEENANNVSVNSHTSKEVTANHLNDNQLFQDKNRNTAYSSNSLPNANGTILEKSIELTGLEEPIQVSAGSSNAEKIMTTNDLKLSQNAASKITTEQLIAENPKSARSTASTEVITSLPSEKLFLQEINYPILTTTSMDVNRNDWRFAINLWTGPNKNYVGYAGSNEQLVEEENTFSSGYFGYNMGAEVQLVYKKHWTFSSGLHYDLQKVKYDKTFYNTISSQDNLLSGIVVNENNELIREIFADSTQLVESVNRKRLLRKNRSIRVPLLVGWETSQYGWNIGVQGGTHLLFNLKNESDNTNPLANFSYGLAISPYVRYEFTPHMSAMLRYDVSRFKHNIKDVIGLVETRYVHGIHVGLQYKF